MAPLPEQKFTRENKDEMIRNWNNIPDELKKLNFWMNYNHTKAPCNSTGREISYKDPKNYRSFDEVITTFNNDDQNKIYGIGFVVKKDDNNVVCIDFDRVMNPDTNEFVEQYPKDNPVYNISTKTEEFVDNILGVDNSYTEISRSGRGIHVLLFGERSPNAPKNIQIPAKLKDGSDNPAYKYIQDFEMFDDRFVTMTGNVYKDRKYLISYEMISEKIRNLLFGSPKINIDKKYGVRESEILNIDDEFFAPCFKRIISSDNPSHISRVALTSYLIQVGRTDEQILAVFSKFLNYSEQKSKKAITSIRSEKYVCPSCSTIKSYGFCQYDECQYIKYAKHPLWVSKLLKIADFMTIGERGGMVFNHEKIADHIIKKYNIIPFGSEKIGIWNGYMYEITDGTNVVKDEIIRIVEDIRYTGSVLDLTKGILGRIYHKSRNPDYPFGSVDYRIFTRNQTLVIDPVVIDPVTNRYKITTKQHDPSDLNDYVFKRDYKPDVDTSYAKNWLDQFGEVNSDRIITMIGTVIATKTLNNNHSFKTMFLIVGAKDAGKTILSEKVITDEIFGDLACSHLALDELVDDKFGLDLMVGKAVNIHDDLPSRFIEKASKLKGMTGSSTKNIECKYENKFAYSQWPVYVFTSNNFPVFKNTELETDAAFWERWRIMRLDTIFTPDRKIIDYKNDQILDGIFKLGVDRSIEILMSNCIAGFDDNLVSEMRRRSDKFELFFDENIEPSEGNYVSTSELWNAYKRFCNDYNLEKREVLQPQVLKDKMRDKKHPEQNLYDKNEYHNRSGYKDLRVKNSQQPRCYIPETNLVKKDDVVELAPQQQILN